jgi:hypothetical protein
MTDTEAMLLLGVGLLYWHHRQGKQPQMTTDAGGRIDAGIPVNGTDNEMTWWDAINGTTTQAPGFSNGPGGVNPDPGSVGRALIAREAAIAWNGDMR